MNANNTKNANSAIVKAALSAAKINTRKIDDKRKSIRRNAKKLNELVHETAMLILKHAAPKEAGGMGFGDCSRSQLLIFDLPASFRRTQLALWFQTFSPIVVKPTNPEWNAKMHKADSKLFVSWDLEGANALPFYMMAEQNKEDDKKYDFKMLVEMVARLSKQIDKKIEEGKVPAEDIESARAISRTVAGLKLERVKVKTLVNSDSPKAAPKAAKKAA